MVTSVSQVLHLGGHRQWRNRRLETSWSQKQVTRKAAFKVAPKAASKFQLQNTSLPDEVETGLGCQASLLGSFSPSGRTGYATRSPKLRIESCRAGTGTSCLVCPAQTCSPEPNLLSWLRGEKPPQGPELGWLVSSSHLLLCRAKGILSEGLSDVCSPFWVLVWSSLPAPKEYVAAWDPSWS